MNRLLSLAIQQVPDIIALLRAAFVTQNPNLPEPTDAELIAAYQSAFVSSLARDDQWLAAHPEPPL